MIFLVFLDVQLGETCLLTRDDLTILTVKEGIMRGIASVLLLLLFGCGVASGNYDSGYPKKPPEEIVVGCCDRSGIYPDWVLGVADDNADIIRRVGGLQLRSGRLRRHGQVHAKILNALRPLDVVFLNSKNRVSGLLVPGQFTHGAIYLGTKAQLRMSGLWQLPELASWRNQISSGAVFLEAVDGGVRLVDTATVLDTDAVLALRPQGIDRKAALSRGLEQMGVPFDMRFDASDPSELFCAELIDLMFPEISLPRLSILGRETILIDAIAADALTNDLAFQIVGYVKATPTGGVHALSLQELAWDLRRSWPDLARTAEP